MKPLQYNVWLPYTEVVQFAFENIASITGAQAIKNGFADRIKDITKERHELFRAIPLDFMTHAFVGQENYFFAFRESSQFNGEFSVDFLPRNPNAIFDESISDLRLANWRVQGFAIGFFARRRVRKKHAEVHEYLVS